MMVAMMLISTNSLPRSSIFLVEIQAVVVLLVMVLQPYLTPHNWRISEGMPSPFFIFW
jgi:hypothetical protein